MDFKSAKRYRKIEQALVSAVQLRLDTAGFAYQKWGGEQWCQSGDWLVDNNGEVYTVAADSFAATYQQVSPGRFRKVGTVWAIQAEADGSVKTLEGKTTYQAGDYLVSNSANGRDTYAIAQERFREMYRPVDD